MTRKFEPRLGTWILYSQMDERWNCSGRAVNHSSFVIPKEAEQMFWELKSNIGEPPDDLEWGYVADMEFGNVNQTFANVVKFPSRRRNAN